MLFTALPYSKTKSVLQAWNETSFTFRSIVNNFLHYKQFVIPYIPTILQALEEIIDIKYS